MAKIVIELSRVEAHAIIRAFRNSTTKEKSVDDRAFLIVEDAISKFDQAEIERKEAKFRAICPDGRL